MTPLTVTLNDPVGNLYLMSLQLWIRSPGYTRRNTSTRVTEKVSLNYKLWLPFGYCRLFVPGDQQRRGVVTFWQE